MYQKRLEDIWLSKLYQRKQFQKEICPLGSKLLQVNLTGPDDTLKDKCCQDMDCSIPDPKKGTKFMPGSSDEIDADAFMVHDSSFYRSKLMLRLGTKHCLRFYIW